MRGVALSLLVVTAAWTSCLAAPRRVEAPAARRLSRPADLQPLDLSASLRRNRLIGEIGADWDAVIVSTADGALDTVIDRHGGQWRGHGAGRDLLQRPNGQDRFAWYVSLQDDPDVTEIQPNWYAVHPGCRQMSIDVLESGGRMDLVTQPALADVGAQVLAASDVTVAIVDSGIAAVDELDGRLLTGIDVLHPRRGDAPAQADRPALDPADPEAWDANGHGTAMATLVAALARDASILPVRVVRGDCTGTVFDLAEGIRAAAAAGADVISVSLSVGRDSTVLRRAVEEAQAGGAIVVAAAGNEGVVEYPASLPGVLAVTAIDDAGIPPSFAPRGARVDLAAPGVDVVTDAPTGQLVMSGTSPAAAIVAAAAAAAAHEAPGVDPLAWRSRVLDAVKPAEGDLTGRIGTGIIDLSRLPPH